MDSLQTQLTQLISQCHQATDEEYRLAADSLIPLCLWFGAEVIFSFLEDFSKESNFLSESVTEPFQ